MDDTRVYTIAEAARELKVSVRWLTEQCRAGQVEHLHMAGKRRFTAQQLEAVKAANTVTVGQKVKPQKKTTRRVAGAPSVQRGEP